MLGLGSYESSDDDGDDDGPMSSKLKTSTNTEEALQSFPQETEDANGESAAHPPPSWAIRSPQFLSDGNTVGPIVGPTGPPAPPAPLNGAASGSQSPYSANRTLLHDLTLPAYPNLNIPLSPPGSPPPGMNEKFTHFLELKRRGVHFNEKLANSPALKNPSLLRKLMEFAAIGDQDQYASTLPKDLWDTTGFPPWAYKEDLAKAQQEMLKKKEEEKAKKQREAIEFVSGTTSATSSRGGTPTTLAGGKGLRGSAAERVMAGLDRDKTRCPHVSDSANRKDIDRRGGRSNGY
ncbi:MAG: hypothetical protein M1830_006146 [Pleopsidium flavum]|nr:MAG: hypothetical protein M1830_006146 [Pleopsidium flavum]